MKTENIFENTTANIISTIVVSFLLPSSNILSNMETQTNILTLFYTPSFIASVLISLFLVILLQFCRKLYFQNKRISQQLTDSSKRLKIYDFVNKKMYQQFNEFGFKLNQQGVEIKKIKITETEKMLLNDLPEDLQKELNNFMSI